MEKTIMPFGTYAGEYLEDIAEENMDYLEFLTNQDWFEKKFKKLYNEVIKLLEEDR